MSETPLSLYVHLPWCVQKCPYCDFNSHKAGDAPPRERYLEALIKDLERESEREDDRPLRSIFLGGGTPSLFTPAEIARLLEAVARNFSLTGDIEITMEANPGTVECGDPVGYRQAGVNRLSIGAQSFSDASLALLGRIHSVADIRRAVAEAKDAGFDSINIDLMYGLPEQSVEQALGDIDAALALGPQHLSWYQLTLEPNTVFYSRPPAQLPDGDRLYEFQERGVERIEAAGLHQYEVSAYSVEGQECRHNLNYWRFGDYLAVGAGAHGKLSDAKGSWRYAKPANPLGYMQSIERGDAAGRPAPLTAPELIFEFMLNASRLRAGFDEALFERHTGLAGELFAKAAEPGVEKGLLEKNTAGTWQPTALGRRFLNDLQGEFLP